MLPLGVVPKKDSSWRIIMDLSSPHGSSVNDFISKDDFALHYATFDQALTLVARYGTNALMAKLDIKGLPALPSSLGGPQAPWYPLAGKILCQPGRLLYG